MEHQHIGKIFCMIFLAMVNQLGVPKFLMALYSAVFRCKELIFIISKLKQKDLCAENTEYLPYYERCQLLNSNPVLAARHFLYRVEEFLKEIKIDDPIRKN